MSDEPSDPPEAPGYPAERVKAFVDAVVAIAMTLLILPLLESVSEAGREGLTAGEWLATDGGLLIPFAISFVLTAMFWIMHHRMFSRVQRVTSMLIWLLMAWLITIVWLPVVTAMTGAFDADPLQESLYIGSMALTSVVSVGIRVYLLAHPELRTSADQDLRIGIAVDLAMTTLFLAALALAIAVPEVTYFGLFLLALTSLLERPYARMLGVRRSRAEVTTAARRGGR